MNHIIIKINNNFRKTYIIGFLVLFLLIIPVTYVGASEINPENVIKLVNESRKADGVAELKENKELTLAAQDKAWDMILNNYFAHTSPSGVSPWHWIEKSGYNYTHAGENLAMNFNQAESQEEAWMKSEKHRQNILNADYEEIGVAVKQGIIRGQMTTITVELFGTRVGKLASSAPQKLVSYEEPAKNFSKANDLSLNFNQPEVRSLLGEFNAPKTKIANVWVQDPQTVLYQNQGTVSKFSWFMAILVLLLVIAVNSVTLSKVIKMHESKATAMVNTAVLIVVLAALVFLR